jgi:hypothetical protein
VRDFDRLSTFFGENFGELIDVAEGVGSSAERESAG